MNVLIPLLVVLIVLTVVVSTVSLLAIAYQVRADRMSNDCPQGNRSAHNRPQTVDNLKGYHLK